MIRTFFLSFVLLGALNAAEIHVNTADYDSLPKENGTYDALVMDPKGEIVESQATYNAAAGTLTVPTLVGGTNVSVFVPALDARYLYYNGNWINPQGNYWDGTNFVDYSNPGWQGDWNNYWHHNWRRGWRNHWRNNHGHHGWKWGDHKHWRGHWHKGAKFHRHHSSHHSSHHGGHHK